jgi:hypothetical protein
VLLPFFESTGLTESDGYLIHQVAVQTPIRGGLSCFEAYLSRFFVFSDRRK